MITLVLDDTRVESIDAAINRLAELIGPAIANSRIARYNTAHSRNGQASFPAVFHFLTQRFDQRIDKNCMWYGCRFGISRRRSDAEDHRLE